MKKSLTNPSLLIHCINAVFVSLSSRYEGSYMTNLKTLDNNDSNNTFMNYIPKYLLVLITSPFLKNLKSMHIYMFL